MDQTLKILLLKQGQNYHQAQAAVSRYAKVKILTYAT